MKYLFTLILFTGSNSYAQHKGYTDSLKAFQQNYVATHEVVKGDDKKCFNFFPVDKAYCVTATFEKISGIDNLKMKTSKGSSQQYFRYGKITFSINNIVCRLYLYQSPELMKISQYKDYLFLPFTDNTSASESYGGGRYIDITIGDIKNNRLVIDFNKAYNPYCAYTSGFNCPIPPHESDLPVAISAGEKVFGKAAH